jgi:RNA polymerase sigma-70 factor (ECF subfamily)
MKPLCEAPCLSLVRSTGCVGKKCLIERARKGNRVARELVFSRLYAPVSHQARMLCREHGDAEDLTQTALLYVFQRLVQLRNSPRLLGWTWRVVQNTHRMSMRQSKFAPIVTVEFSENTFSAVETQSVGPFELLAEQELQDALFEKIRELPPNLRDALELRVFEGKTTAQTAKRLRISEGAVRTRLVRARRALRSRLDTFENGPASSVPSQLNNPDLDAALRQMAAAHGLEMLAVHPLA